MDLLARTLEVTRTTGAIWAHVTFSGPWALRCDAVPMAGIHIVERGGCWLHHDDRPDPIRLEQGDIAFIPRGDGHLLYDQPSADRMSVVDLLETADHTVSLTREPARVERAGDGPVCGLICGGYYHDRHEPHPLLSELPPVLHVPSSETPPDLRAVQDLVIAEIRSARVGRAAVLDRLIDTTLVLILRLWVESQRPGDGIGWLPALIDPLVRRSLEVVEEPDPPATVAAWAKTVGMSRSAFADRFAAAVGTSPGRYLTQHRLGCAARLLRRTDLSIAAIAREAGYDSEFSFSRAFKRFHGSSPTAYRRANSEGPPPAEASLTRPTRA